MFNKINICRPWQKFIVYIVLILVTLAVYWQVNQYDFVINDDPVYVTENIHVQYGITLDEFRWAMSTVYFDGWHPMLWLYYMLDHQIHGLNAGRFHLTNLILHIMSTLLLFWLFHRMTGTIWRSAFVSAFFALHPLHVESVAFISERKDVLSAFFWMLTLCFYVYYTEKPVIRRYILILVAFMLALMSKLMVVTLPVIMILLDCWPLKRFELKKTGFILWQLREKAPFFILVAVVSIFHLYISSKPDYFPIQQFQTYITFSYRIVNVPIAFIKYIGKTFWPYDLAVFYPFSWQIPFWQVLEATLLIAVISVAVVVMIKRFPYLFVGWLWYSITILPVIGLIYISTYEMTDRYHYLPSIGIAVMLAWGIPSLIKNQEIYKKILFFAGISFLAIMAALTWHQCSYWKNSITLWGHCLQVTKHNTLAHNYLAHAFFEKGKLQEAIDQYTKTIRIKSDYFDTMYAYGSRGAAYAALNQNQLAVKDFNMAILLKPNYADFYIYRGVSHAKLGQYQQAIDDYNMAIRLKRDSVLAYNNRAYIYFFIHGNKKPGCDDAQKACSLGNCKGLEWAKGKGFCR